MTAPTWPTCALDTAACRGIQVAPFDRCLAHLSPTERSSSLGGLDAGNSLDFSGTTFTQVLLTELLSALRRSDRLQDVHLSSAEFLSTVDFSGMVFQGACWFDNAIFHESVNFQGASFQSSACFLRSRVEGAADFNGAYLGDIDFSGAHFGSANFSGITHTGSLNFSEVTFSDFVTFEGSQIKAVTFHKATFGPGRFWRTDFTTSPRFSEAQFLHYSSFEGAQFRDGAYFDKAKFVDVTFEDATFTGVAWFANATFKSGNFAGVEFGQSLVCSLTYATEALNFGSCNFMEYFVGPVRAQMIFMANAAFHKTVRIEAATEHLDLHRARFEAPAAFHVRHAVVEIADAHPSFPITIASHSEPFTSGAAQLQEDFSQEGSALGKVKSVRGLDAALIVLKDIDLRQCTFEGAYHLDQISLEGRCRFSYPPQNMRWGRAWVPLRVWTQRKVLEDERAWRATVPDSALDRGGWGGSVTRNGVVDSQNISATYRQLRKALEDSLNEPGAADFYYGEMEMRRRDREISRSERGLLHIYWALSGYGLRASRSIVWLLSAMAVTVLLMMGWGLPGASPKQEASGIIRPPGEKTTLVIDKTDPVLTLPIKDRYSGKRLEKAGQVVLNSVVFRSSGQDLTTVGTWIEMVSRFTEPILLGFAALAIRGRIKRS
ncbi:pentapeptide repeat-containing protein [Streptomyces purpurascens]|uniref:pentapeptide repeat-containing protein n=1 Tax=Streptomyces purpurascens TaxID=1924 RepID=UPI0034090344